MAKHPKKGVTGWKYEADVCGEGFQVSGPSLHDAYFTRREDAEMVAAALNLATNFREIKQQAEDMKANIDRLTEFR